LNALTRDRWNQLLRAAGAREDGSSCYDRLTSLYREPHRHYHNLQHIAECLQEFDSARNLAREPVAVELAIWFHDAIYDPRASDNEERSADLARQCLAGLGLNDPLQDSVARLILATKHHDNALHADTPLLVDVDLAILGQPGERFWQYEAAIRQEYDWVDKNIFAMKRAEILERFLARGQIYNTGYFFSKYEQQARANLIASIEKLRRA